MKRFADAMMESGASAPDRDHFRFDHERYEWTYEKADLEQGGYYLCDELMQKTAVILPQFRDQPIHEENNAMLCVREYGNDAWDIRAGHTFLKALAEGEAHHTQYLAREEAEKHEFMEELNRQESQDQGMSQ